MLRLLVKRSGLILFCVGCDFVVFLFVRLLCFLCLGFDFDLEYVVVFNMSSI